MFGWDLINQSNEIAFIQSCINNVFLIFEHKSRNSFKTKVSLGDFISFGKQKTVFFDFDRFKQRSNISNETFISTLEEWNVLNDLLIDINRQINF